MFDTWGPYTCKTSEQADLDALWKQFRATDPSNIENGIGIYLISVQDANGEVTPWYVGQTYKSFGDRLITHFKKKRFETIMSKGSLSILLIARAKDGKIVTRQAGRREKLDRKAIDWLELDLIDRCLQINPDLLNRQFVRYLNSIWVGGYRGKDARTTKAMAEWPAYAALAKVLRLGSEG